MITAQHKKKLLKSAFESCISKTCVITLKSKESILGILLNKSRNTNKAIVLTPKRNHRGQCIEKVINLKNIQKITLIFPKTDSASSKS